MDDKSKKLMLIGYDVSFKGYKLYDPRNRRKVISRDVQFDEDSSWDWNIKDEDYNFLP